LKKVQEKRDTNENNKIRIIAEEPDISMRKSFDRRKKKFSESPLGKFCKKISFSTFAMIFAFTIFLNLLPQARIIPITAETATSFEMAVDLNEYYQNVQDSNYYAWRGKVNLTAKIASGDVTTGSVVAYLDDLLTPIFTIDTTIITKDSENKYPIATQINTENYTRGYHTFRIYDGAVASFSAKSPIMTVPVYFEYSEIANVINVTNHCHMRAGSSTSFAEVTDVLPGTTGNILNQIAGQQVSGTGPDSSYDTNIWYQIQYPKDGTVYTGYVSSAYLKKMATGISKMKVTATSTVVEEFMPGKTTYNLNLPYAANALSVEDLVLYNKADTLEVYLNGAKVDSSFRSLLLTTGTNKVEFKVISAMDSTSVTYTYNIWRIAESTEAEFQAQLANFPESYKPALRALHSKYPDWLFTVFNTGLDWNAVIDRQASGQTSLIGISEKEEYKYDNVPVEPTFVLASRAAIEYYVDPRNFLTERQVFQFEQLSYNAAMHTLAGIQRILLNSGLAGMQDMFLQAGIESQVSPFHLAARARQEVTVWNPIGLSEVATGTYEGAGGIYKGYFNFYNIGTGADISHTVVVEKGLAYAKTINPEYNLPWDSRLKAIVGGGKYIGKNYITAGQDTLYLQKFDVDDKAFGLYWHQYMQNVQAPESEASNTYIAYSQIGMLANSFIFRIPVYSNMPALTSPKPEDTNKLNTLDVAGYSLSPSFNGTSDDIYHVTVPTSVDQITINATTLNSNASIAGLGVKPINVGSDNHFTVSCTPSNGVTRVYTIQVTRTPPENSSNNLLSSLSISGSGGIDLSPAFVPGQTGPFSANVADTVSEVTVAAATQNENAAIAVADIGARPLAYGQNTLMVNVTAQNGALRTYTIHINRAIPKAASNTFLLSGGIISGVPIATTVSAFKAGMNSSVTTLKLFTASGAECPDSALVGTGMIMRVYFGSTLMEEHTIKIYGDANGDGKINSTDVTSLKIHILKLNLLTGKYLESCDVNKDGKYNSTDFTILKRHILKLQEINQK